MMDIKKKCHLSFTCFFIVEIFIFSNPRKVLYQIRKNSKET